MSGRVGGARSAVGAAVMAVGAAAAASAAWAQDTTERVSVRSNGAQGNAGSGDPALSADGRLVAFASGASNLVAGDTNGVFDVFVRDRQAGTTRRVSVGPGGGQKNGASFEPALSADGRFVAFWSSAANLVPGDTNGVADAFVHDRRTARIERVSLGPRGAQADEVTLGVALSADGRFVAFASQATNLVPGDANGTTDVFVRDRELGTTRRVSVGPGGAQGDMASEAPALSAHGRLVAFHSAAGGLVPGDANGVEDVFVRALGP